MLIALRHRIWQLIESLGISEVFNSNHGSNLPAEFIALFRVNAFQINRTDMALLGQCKEGTLY